MLIIELNWLYLCLWKTDKARYCYSDVTLAVGEVYDSLDPIGESSRSKVKIYEQAPIELKFTRTDPCDILNTEKIQLTHSDPIWPFFTRRQTCRLVLFLTKSSFCQSSWLSWLSATIRCSTDMARRIFSKLHQDDHWPCPNMSYDFNLRMTFDLDIQVKNVILL